MNHCRWSWPRIAGPRPDAGRWAAAALAAALIAAAAPAVAASGDIMPPSTPPAGIVVSHPWIRMLMRSRPAAGYFTLLNHSATPYMLTGAASSGCGSLMLHESLTQNGIDKMVMVGSLPVPAHGRLTFTPGGYHLMCMSPAATLVPGSSVPVTLRFGDGHNITVNFPVRGGAGQ